jgi:hypothetical protein
MSEAVYVVQEQRDAVDDSGQTLWTGWLDIATVTVPARTHRKTVIEKALEEAGIMHTNGVKLTVRVLDEEAARETPVETEQPPPRLKIG